MTRSISEAEGFRHTAAVCRAESIARQISHPAFSVTLAQWADNFDRRAANAERRSMPDQPDLFQEQTNG